jgi:hypothetical protein
LGVKRTFLERISMSAFDPKRTFIVRNMLWVTPLALPAA